MSMLITTAIEVVTIQLTINLSGRQYLLFKEVHKYLIQFLKDQVAITNNTDLKLQSQNYQKSILPLNNKDIKVV